MSKLIKLTGIWLLVFISIQATAQKVVNHQSQSWFSINTTIKIKGKFGFLADVHVRRNNFIADPSFYFVRGAINYWYSDNITFALGYGHMWVAPTIAGYKTYSNENRIYQQVQLTCKMGKLSLLQKLRNEQRWQEIIVSDVSTNKNKFTDRVRYLLSTTIPFSTDKKIPSLVIADELCVQFGEEVVYNAFDQNRIFIGIKQSLCKNLSFDLGYMYVTQQKSSGYQYDENNTFRLFFYYTPDLRKKKNY